MDLNLIPLVRQGGQDQTDLPGLHIAAKPRRPARGRQADRLILFLTMEGNAPLGPSQQDQLLARMAGIYYKTPGSVTAAMRAVAESLNQNLLERNLNNASSGQQGIGLLILIVEREGKLYLAQCGPTNAFLSTGSGLEHYYDPQPARRGLGLGRTTPIYYSQASLSSNDILLLAPQLPESWTETALSGLYGQGPEVLRPRLLRQVGSELTALLIQAKDGPGKTYLYRPKPAATPAVTGEAAASEAILLPASTPPPIETPPAAQVTPADSRVGAEVAAAAAATASTAQAQIPAQPAPSGPVATERGSRSRAPRKGVFTTLGAAVATSLGALASGLRTLLRRMLPEESLATLSPPVMAFIAVAIPLVVVAVSTVIYFQRGRAGQYDMYYAQAVQAAGQAQAQSDPQASLAAWQSVLTYLNQAEAYQTTSDSQALRSQANQVIDQKELIRRLDYQLALTEALPGSVQIARVAVTPTDLYLLDSSTGTVLRAISTGRGYELDNNFQCGPGYAGSQDIGPLIDIQALPGESGAALIGMDATGNVLTCNPGDPPLFEPLAPPFTQWGKPQAFTIDSNNLYVLDPPKNAVWIYSGLNKSAQPEAFFTQDFPPMQDVIDLVVDRSDLYMLHADGHLTLCTYSELGVAKTHCTDPLPYVDSRPGHEGQSITPAPVFSQINLTQPPDPSIYLLDPLMQSISHFSKRLAFQRQLRPQDPLSIDANGKPASATAFAFSPDNRVVFLALGNQVYYAGMP
jgi:hypothetical protein